MFLPHLSIVKFEIFGNVVSERCLGKTFTPYKPVVFTSNCHYLVPEPLIQVFAVAQKSPAPREPYLEYEIAPVPLTVLSVFAVIGIGHIYRGVSRSWGMSIERHRCCVANEIAAGAHINL